MQQILEAYQIPSRILDLGIVAYLGAGSPTALQVQPKDRQTAMLLLSPVDESATETQE